MQKLQLEILEEMQWMQLRKKEKKMEFQKMKLRNIRMMFRNLQINMLQRLMQQ